MAKEPAQPPEGQPPKELRESLRTCEGYGCIGDEAHPAG